MRQALKTGHKGWPVSREYQGLIETRPGRIHNFDVLRGFIVLLACYQHYAYYLNVWYRDYFNSADLTSDIYQVHRPFLGQLLQTPDIGVQLAWFFTPWVSQLYLAMAAFNLARRDQAEFQPVFSSKIKLFFGLWGLFILENFLVAPNFGEAISFYPIMAWMLILIVMSWCYRSWGLKGILGLCLLYLLVVFTPLLNLEDHWELLVREWIHDQYEYDARLSYFFPSAALGFLLGYFHYHGRAKAQPIQHKLLWVGGLLALLIYFFGAPEFSMDPYDMFATEHLLAESTLGIIGMLGVQAALIWGALSLERRGYSWRVPLLTWVGVSSLLVFALHRVLFVYVIMPWRVYLGGLLEAPLVITFFGVSVYIGLVLIMTYLLQRSRLPQLLFKGP